ncbi:cyclic nucleotide-binding domain-containing protein [Halopseudomonas phragmitis]|uniref:cAMP-binding protein n=2 Tax=Pseudomonadaceae TaxID=135621 RepID=A0A1V0B0W8_9GAMM|nr:MULTISPECIES: cyclic nucleotide-binding domain-containing protein [Pseudomonadaceae]AQZ93569.1 cAMP-binding protein [Halopseudomonas phragmitis]PAU86190.1 cAMP-binding protein [Pseudomonas sp. WN033]RHW20226.1 cyclic nucleotide-binding domain-containing protein [Pseudomonas jilinensis]
MYLIGDQPPYAEKLISTLQSIPEQLLEGLEPCADPIALDAVKDLYQSIGNNRLYLLKSGLLHALIDNKPLFYLQEGDLLGLRQGLNTAPCTYLSEEPLVLIPYDREALFRHIHESNQRQELFTQYILGQAALMSDALARSKPPEVRPVTGFQHFAPGAELIRQGDEADHVFIITEGHAEAFVEGIKVGDVQKDEIFGAMALFTREKRSATVIASVPTTVMMIPKDQFLALMQSNPRIAHSLIESMARRIDLMNKELTHYKQLAGK